MKCPRCGNEWDVSKSPCPTCNLFVHLAQHSGGIPRVNQPARTTAQTGAIPPLQSRTGEMRPLVRNDIPSRPPLRSPSVPLPKSLRERAEQRNTRASSPDQEQGPGVSQPLSWSNSMQTPQPDPFFSLDQGQRPSQASPFERPSRPLRAVNKEIVNPGDEDLRSNPPPRRGNIQSRPPRTGRMADEVQRTTRPPRLVNDSMTQSMPRIRSVPPSMDAFSLAGISGGTPEIRPLMPGTLLKGGRYRLQEVIERQDWRPEVYEVTWSAQDAQRSGAAVVIQELVVPENNALLVQAMIRTATMALTSVGRHASVPQFWDMFNDQLRNFFVFEPITGESLLARMRRTGRALSEAQVIECCLQMLDVLELLAQQNPPQMHGLIAPQHIIASNQGDRYVLSNFSLVLAGGAMQLISGMDRSRLTPYMPPEMLRGIADPRLDLYSLAATAYHAVTGSLPTAAGATGSIPRAQQLNPLVSKDFETILSRGLRPIASQRYQSPDELRGDLLALRSGRNDRQRSGPMRTLDIDVLAHSLSTPMPAYTPVSPRPFPPVREQEERVQPVPISNASNEEDDINRLLLPRPEELPPLEDRNDTQQSLIWLAGILICLLVIVILSRGFL